MPREIDDKKTRKALRRLARAKRAAEQSDTPEAQLSEWEDEFIGSLEERLDKFGSAFNDPDKGNLDDALSARQSVKLREIEKKAKGKGKGRKPMSRGSGFKRKSPSGGGRSRDINDDIIAPVEDSPGREPPAAPAADAAPAPAPQTPAPTGFKPVIIEGGKLKS
ncbi:hypothetical protein [Maricaulis sp.]|uniref:hypothetical protein n=1 Tax=Maricaulis sp. TaxID=1486257 RepID=UPI00260CF228|nr:hypothetical protein [Maricaulis sp.]